ncbi:MAG: TonB-dependent receptor [Lacunisphaera sp.]|nr:TonB-dependent receptor [Lacunisphaera sp.]
MIPLNVFGSFAPRPSGAHGGAPRLGSLTALFALVLALLHPVNLRAEEGKKRDFDLPADVAEKSLKRLASQSGVEVVVGTEVASKVRTNAVRGEFSPLVAATRMLSGTELSVDEDQATHALIVGRRPLAPPAPGTPQQSNAVEAIGGNEVVQLETYRVSTALGRYAEENTSAGSKMPIATKNLPATVQIFNASAIKDRVAETLDDIYPYVVGMAREAPISNGFNIRGFTAQSGGTQQNIQIDNLPGSASRYSSPSTVNVDRVEIVKGPTSVLYGKLNPGGLVNIITKRPKEKHETNISGSVSSYAGTLSSAGEDMSFKASLDQTGPIDAAKHWLYRVIVAGDDVQSWRPYGYFKNYYFYPSLTYRWNEKTSFTLQLEVVREKRQYDNSIPYPPSNNPANLPASRTFYMDKDTPERDSGEVINAFFQHLFANNWKLSVGTRSVFHADGVRAYRINQVFSPVVVANPIANSTVKRTFFDRTISREYNFVDANIYGDFGPENFRHTLLFGVNGGVERSDSDFPISGVNASGANAAKALFDFVNYYQPVTGLSPIPAPGTQIAPRRTIVYYYNYGAYVSDRMKFGRHWNVLLGLRHDRQDADSIEVFSQLGKKGKVSATLPTAGLVFEANDAFTFYLSTNRSFRPAPADANVDENGRVDFPPEKGSQLEFGIKSQLFDKRLIVNFSAYRITKQNVLEATGTFAANGVAISRIQGEQRSEGVELEGIWLPRPNWQIQAGGTYIDAKVTKSSNPVFIGRRMVNVARASGNLWTRYNVPNGALRGFGAGLGVIMQGKRLAGTPTTQTSSYMLPGYTRFDTAFYYQMKRYDFALNITNVIDRKYIASSGENAVFPAEPRRVTLSASHRF